MQYKDNEQRIHFIKDEVYKFNFSVVEVDKLVVLDRNKYKLQCTYVHCKLYMYIQIHVSMTKSIFPHKFDKRNLHKN